MNTPEPTDTEGLTPEHIMRQGLTPLFDVCKVPEKERQNLYDALTKAFYVRDAERDAPPSPAIERAVLAAKIELISYLSRNGYLTSAGQEKAETLIERFTNE